MRRLLFFLITTLSINAYSQIKLEHTFDEEISANVGTRYTIERMQGTTNMEYPFIKTGIEDNGYIIKGYDKDYNLVKDDKISFTLQPNYNIYSCNIWGDGILNSGQTEFLIISKSSSGEKYLLEIYDDEGVLVYSFGEFDTIPYVYPYVINFDDEYKIVVNVSGKTLVYLLENQYTNTNENRINKGYVYPNPVNSIINLPVPLSVKEGVALIFDQNGNTIEYIKINGERNITLNVSTYSEGVYIYKVNNETYKFIVKK